MRIFIAGPYGDDNPQEIINQNVHKANTVAKNLIASGHQVYCPHTMSYGWEGDSRVTKAERQALSRSFLKYWAEAVYRIPGESVGADSEVQYAKVLEKPIFGPFSQIIMEGVRDGTA
jgi:hypothetical protein